MDGKKLLDYAIRYEEDDASKISVSQNWYEFFNKARLGRLTRTVDARFSAIDSEHDLAESGQTFHDFSIEPPVGSWVMDSPTRVVSQVGPKNNVGFLAAVVLAVLLCILIYSVKRRSNDKKIA